MSTEEDIGALKKGMKNVELSAEKTAGKVDELVETVINHNATMLARQDMAEERHDDLRESHDSLKTAHYKLKGDVPSQKKITGTLALGVPIVALIGAWINNVWDALTGGGG